MCEEGPNRTLIVHILYYHTKYGARNLAHFEAEAVGAGWRYHANAFP